MKKCLCCAALVVACLTTASPAEPLAEQPLMPADDWMIDAAVDPDDSPMTDPSMAADDIYEVVAAETAAGGPSTPVNAPASRALHFRVTARATYDDNIFIQPKNRESDFIFSTTPGFTLGAGDLTDRKGAFVSLSYDATAYFFLENEDLNSLDHDVHLQGQWAGAKLTTAGYAKFSSLTGTASEVGSRVNEKLYIAGLSANYQHSDKTTFGGSLTATYSDYQEQLDTLDTAFRLWGDNQVGALTKLGLGLTLGRTEVASGSTQTYEQLLARLSYELASKVTLNTEIGGELRQIQGGSTQFSPVFSVGAVYIPYPLLALKASGYRAVQPSIISTGTNTTTTGVSIGATYTFLSDFQTTVSGAYEYAEYRVVSGSGATNRRDNYFLLRFSQGYALTEHASITAFYQYRRNTSTEESYSFRNNQIGIECSIGF